jgi:Sec7-like guanine-nucleotide exchange factor
VRISFCQIFCRSPLINQNSSIDKPNSSPMSSALALLQSVDLKLRLQQLQVQECPETVNEPEEVIDAVVQTAEQPREQSKIPQSSNLEITSQLLLAPPNLSNDDIGDFVCGMMDTDSALLFSFNFFSAGNGSDYSSAPAKPNSRRKHSCCT